MRRRVPAALLPPRDPEPGRRATRRELEARISATIAAELTITRDGRAPLAGTFALLSRLSAMRQAAELELETGAAMRNCTTLELF